MLDEIIKIVNTHHKWRRQECINMIASESVMSPLAEKLYTSDFSGRYNEHTSGDCHYNGTKYSYEIEDLCNSIFRKNFNTRFADARPLSGGIANLSVFAALAKMGDILVGTGIPNGAHVSHTRYGMAGVRGMKNVDMFFDKDKMNINVERTIDIIKKVNPKIVMFGASVFLFPQPIREIKESIDPNIKIVYDSAHVFGLVYNKKFQKPFEEGADIITSSTHKTFQGPQGGIVIGNNNMDEKEWKKIETALFPKVVSNSHIHRFPALAVTALEMNKFGEEYSTQVIRNAKYLADALTREGFDVLCPQLGFTESHQAMVNVKKFGGGKTVANILEECNIITSKSALPGDSSDDATRNPSGIRLGVQELTRFGMREREMKAIATFFRNALIDKKDPKKIKEEVIEFRKQFQKIKYCFDV
ncbi:MAG: serine hydroxymethyltransferase [Candidatus Aenigmatarchaeota archaeon]